MYRKFLRPGFFIVLAASFPVNLFPVLQAQMIQEGLVSHWTFDEADVTDTTVTDVHGNNDGTILGFPDPPLPVPGKIGEAFEFDGFDDAIDIGSPADGSLDFGPEGDFTFMAWVKISELPEGDQVTIMSKGDGGGNPRILFKIFATQIFTTIKQGAVGVNVTSDRSIVDGQWHHLTFLADRDVATLLYVDGILDTEGLPSAGADVNTEAPLYIGASVRADLRVRRYFKGLMDDVAIYNRALTAEEILQNMTRGGCVVRRTLTRPRYTPGGTVPVTLEARSISQPATVTETIPAGWDVGATGGGTRNGNTLVFSLTADGEVTYELKAPVDSCGPVTLAGSIAGGGGCEGAVVGDGKLACIPVPPGAVVHDFDATGPTSDGELEDFFDFLGAEKFVGPTGWRLDPNAQNAADGSRALHTTGDTDQLENWFSRVALLRPNVFEARDLFLSADITLDALSGDADDNVGLFFRFRGASDVPLENEFYFLRINAGGNSSNVRLHRVRNGLQEELVRVPNNLPFLVQEGDTVTVSVQAVENEINVFLNGESVPGLDPYLDEFDPILVCGQAGVGQNSNPTYFDNLTVARLDVGPCPCLAIRRLPASRYGPGDPVMVTLNVRNVTGATVVTETFPPGWTVTEPGGGTVDGNKITFNLIADGEVSYQVAGPDDFCEAVEFSGTLSGAGGCDAETFGSSAMTCIFGCGELQESGGISEMLFIGPIDLGGDAGADCDDNGGLGTTDYLRSADGTVDETSVQAVAGSEIRPDFGGGIGGVGVAAAPNPNINPRAGEGVLTVWLAEANNSGRINFDDGDKVGGLDNYVIYGLVYLDNVTGQPLKVTLKVGSDDAVKVIVNGERVHLNSICRGVGGVGAADPVPVDLEPGINTVLIAVVEREGDSGVRLMVYDEFDAGPVFPGDIIACLSPGDVPVKREICDNDVDDDGDGLIDCNDPDCGNAARCLGTPFIRGDADGRSGINITDAIFILNFLFLGGEAPTCREAANVDGQGDLNITDGISLLNFLFQGGEPPPAPYPNCDVPEEDGIGCESFEPCTAN